MYPYSYYTKTNPSSEPTVEISVKRLRDLLQPIISLIEVDETWYLAEYPDVAAAVSRGTFASAADHFAISGFKEGRAPHFGWSLQRSAMAKRAKTASA